MKKLLCLTCILGILFFVAPIYAGIIDFEDLGVASGSQYDPPDGSTTTSGGFDFTPGPLNSLNDLHFGNANYNTIGSTTELLSHEDVIMTKAGGGTFSVQQFLWGSSFEEESFFTVEGELFGGGTVSQVFNPDMDTNTLETFFLPASFTDLVSVKWIHIGGVQGLQNIDNIYVDGVDGTPATAVPEPSILILLSIGFGAVALTPRRKKR